MTRRAIQASRPGPTASKRRAAGSPDKGPWHAAIGPLPDWTDAACHDQPSDTFFPTAGDQHAINHAKAICETCPIQARCLTFGMTQPFGIWGRLTEEERAALRRRRGRPPKRTTSNGGAA
ncbi:MAG TPA: WhiB family transcriptional regulator [Actinomycetes bacterium]|jgi:WhiB family redox-sensing transcriptional regulator|nr:WhiB family transcriptional regulator [Actinomycetes bacterium]